MFRLATLKDIKTILLITKKCVHVMNEIDNIGQWDDNYPNLDVFTNDIENKQLYVYEYNNVIVGFIVLNTHEYEEYNEVTWSSYDKCLVVHRFAVDPDCQNKGFAGILLQNCKKVAFSKNINYIKIDTSSKNKKMNNLILKNGFIFKGTMNLKGDEYPLWNCYDLLINDF